MFKCNKYKKHIVQCFLLLHLGIFCILGSIGYERMIETHLSIFYSFSNHVRGKRSRNSVSLLRLAMLSTSFLVSRDSRDFTTFTLHDLTDFYVERATAPHYNK